MESFPTATVDDINGGGDNFRTSRESFFGRAIGRAETYDERRAALPHFGDGTAGKRAVVDKLQRRDGLAAGGTVPND